MRITTVDKSFPISYDVAGIDNNAPVFDIQTSLNPVKFTLNGSPGTWMYTKPVTGLGAGVFPKFSNARILRLSAVTKSTAFYVMPTGTSVAFGYHMQLPNDIDENYAYQVTGNIRPSYNYSLHHAIRPSLIIGHRPSELANSLVNFGGSLERYYVDVVAEFPLVPNINDDGHVTSYYPIDSFNFSLHDNGAPPLDGSAIFFGICVRNYDPNASSLSPIFFNLNVWRQLSPIKVANQWQA